MNRRQVSQQSFRRQEFSKKKLEILKKKSLKFVCILAKQSICPFNLTGVFNKKNLNTNFDILKLVWTPCSTT